MRRNPIVCILIGVSIAYWVIAPFFKSRYVIEFIDGIVIACALAVTWAYGRKFLEGARQSKPDVLDLWIFGIAGSWSINAIDRQWRQIARVTDSEWMIHHHFIGYLLLLLAVFACCHLIVRGAVADGVDPRYRHQVTPEAWSLIVVAVICGIAIGLLAVAIDTILIGK